MFKRVVIAASVGFLILLALATIIFYRYRGALTALGRLPSMPEGLTTARVVLGNDFLSKESLYEVPGIGVITDIRVKDGALTVVGRSGAASFSHNGSLLSKISFDNCNSDVTVTDVGFLCRGTWSTDVRMFGADGKTLWSYGGGASGIDDAAAGNIGGAHRVVVGLNGGGGVRLLDSEGKEIWKQDDGNVWHVEIVGADSKTGSVIVHSNAGGELTVRDENGKVGAQYTPEFYLAHFALTAWGDDSSLNKLISSDEGSVYIISIQGKTLAKFATPGSVPNQSEAKGTPIRFGEAGPFYAILLRYQLWDRSVLYVHNQAHQLVYEEINDRDCGDLRAVAGPGDTEDLLLGCDETVRKYSVRKVR